MTTSSSRWCLFLDDLRNPKDVYSDPRSVLGDKDRWVVARSTEEAKRLVGTLGMPTLMSLDHDLGGDDTTMIFLGWLAREWWNGTDPVAGYLVHSANPTGAKNICAFMDSWRKSMEESDPVE